MMIMTIDRYIDKFILPVQADDTDTNLTDLTSDHIEQLCWLVNSQQDLIKAIKFIIEKDSTFLESFVIKMFGTDSDYTKSGLKKDIEEICRSEFSELKSDMKSRISKAYSSILAAGASHLTQEHQISTLSTLEIPAGTEVALAPVTYIHQPVLLSPGAVAAQLTQVGPRPLLTDESVIEEAVKPDTYTPQPVSLSAVATGDHMGATYIPTSLDAGAVGAVSGMLEYQQPALLGSAAVPDLHSYESASLGAGAAASYDTKGVKPSVTSSPQKASGADEVALTATSIQDFKNKFTEAYSKHIEIGNRLISDRRAAADLQIVVSRVDYYIKKANVANYLDELLAEADHEKYQIVFIGTQNVNIGIESADWFSRFAAAVITSLEDPSFKKLLSLSDVGLWNGHVRTAAPKWWLADGKGNFLPGGDHMTTGEDGLSGEICINPCKSDVVPLHKDTEILTLAITSGRKEDPSINLTVDFKGHLSGPKATVSVKSDKPTQSTFDGKHAVGQQMAQTYIYQPVSLGLGPASTLRDMGGQPLVHNLNQVTIEEFKESFTALYKDKILEGNKYTLEQRKLIMTAKKSGPAKHYIKKAMVAAYLDELIDKEKKSNIKYQIIFVGRMNVPISGTLGPCISYYAAAVITTPQDTKYKMLLSLSELGLWSGKVILRGLGGQNQGVMSSAFAHYSIMRTQYPGLDDDAIDQKGFSGEIEENFSTCDFVPLDNDTEYLTLVIRPDRKKFKMETDPETNDPSLNLRVYFREPAPKATAFVKYDDPSPKKEMSVGAPVLML